jgi:hypothetical protein
MARTSKAAKYGALPARSNRRRPTNVCGAMALMIVNPLSVVHADHAPTPSTSHQILLREAFEINHGLQILLPTALLVAIECLTHMAGELLAGTSQGNRPG